MTGAKETSEARGHQEAGGVSTIQILHVCIHIYIGIIYVCIFVCVCVFA